MPAILLLPGTWCLYDNEVSFTRTASQYRWIGTQDQNTKEEYLGGLHFPPDPIFQSKALDLHSCGVQQDMTRFRILEKTWGKWEILGFLAIQVQSQRRATEVYSVAKFRTFAKRERHNF